MHDRCSLNHKALDHRQHNLCYLHRLHYLNQGHHHRDAPSLAAAEAHVDRWVHLGVVATRSHGWGSLVRVGAFVAGVREKVIAAEKEEHLEAYATETAFLELVYRCGCEQLAAPDEEVVVALVADYQDSSTEAVAVALVIEHDRDLLLAFSACGLSHGACEARH